MVSTTVGGKMKRVSNQQSDRKPVTSLQRYRVKQIRRPRQLQQCQETPQFLFEDGIVFLILQYLPVSSIVRSMRVDKKWQELCNKATDPKGVDKKAVQDGKELKRAARVYAKLAKDDPRRKTAQRQDP
ncbi:MAG: hypothetical protein SGARI_004895 [Bacillariaceae sp.]